MAELTDAEIEARRLLHEKTRDDLLKRQLSNSENADRAVLTVSTGALGFSLAFLKDIVKPATASHLLLLHLSWICFMAAIVVTLVSFYISQKAIEHQLVLAQRYYLDCDESAFSGPTCYARITNACNYGGAIVFVVGLLLSCAFAALNL